MKSFQFALIAGAFLSALACKTASHSGVKDYSGSQEPPPNNLTTCSPDQFVSQDSSGLYVYCRADNGTIYAKAIPGAIAYPTNTGGAQEPPASNNTVCTPDQFISQDPNGLFVYCMSSGGVRYAKAIPGAIAYPSANGSSEPPPAGNGNGNGNGNGSSEPPAGPGTICSPDQFVSQDASGLYVYCANSNGQTYAKAIPGAVAYPR